MVCVTVPWLCTSCSIIIFSNWLIFLVVSCDNFYKSLSLALNSCVTLSLRVLFIRWSCLRRFSSICCYISDSFSIARPCSVFIAVCNLSAMSFIMFSVLRLLTKCSISFFVLRAMSYIDSSFFFSISRINFNTFFWLSTWSFSNRFCNLLIAWFKSSLAVS